MNAAQRLPVRAAGPTELAEDPFRHRFCVAPMLDLTDRHERFFLRLLTRRALLYTEMVSSGALLHGDRGHLLAYDPKEQPLALQLGGSDPEQMARCARLGEQAGYCEININVGCPSERVQAGRFGACLMAEPQRVAACYSAMQAAASVPVTVKCRIGVDNHDRYQDLARFVTVVAAAGCRVFIVHARKAWLAGLSPRQNREVPPLRYDTVYRLKQEHPQLTVVINGGITSLDQVQEHLTELDGVMVGREAYKNPFKLATVDSRFFGAADRALSRKQVLEQYQRYIAEQLAHGVPLKAMSRHILGLFQGQPGARVWRQTLSEQAVRPGAGLEVIEIAYLRLCQAQAGHRTELVGHI